MSDPASPEEALAHIEALKKRLNWQFPAENVPERKREPRAPEKKEPPSKRYERCALCENVLAVDEQGDGVCLACIRKYQTPSLLFKESV